MNSEGIGTGMPSGVGQQGKIRIYDLAKELSVPNKDMVAKIRALGIEAKNHMSNLEAEDVARVKRAFDKERHENLIEERLTATVIRRRTKDGSAVRQAPVAVPPVVAAATSAAREAHHEPAHEARRDAGKEARETPHVVVRDGGAPSRADADAHAATTTGRAATGESRADIARAGHAPDAAGERGHDGARPKQTKHAAASARTAEAVAVAVAVDAAVNEERSSTPDADHPIASSTASTVAAKPSADAARQPVERTREELQRISERVIGREGREVREIREIRNTPQRTIVVETRESRGSSQAAANRAASGTQTTQPADQAQHAQDAQRAQDHRSPGVGRGDAQSPASSTEGSSSQVAATSASEAGTASSSSPAVAESIVPKREEVRLGPTGRVIELPSMRQPVIQVQVTERDKPGATRGVRDLSQKRDMSGRDRFAASKQQGKKRAVAGKKQKSTTITTPAQHKRVVKMEDTIAVADVARQMGVKATDVLKKLWSMGMTGITLNSAIDPDAAGLVAQEFGFEVENVAFQEADVFEQGEDAAEDLVVRAPVVTIMGHVDHGKTSLLDAIRDANVASGEAGGITQHIGAYKVRSGEHEVVFLDTPGHEAFTAMRARGAQATDIVVLVVAADDGVMPQTIEALQHAKDAEVPIIVAVNKIDKPGAQPERIRQQLSAHGLTPEAWGGETIYADVSARTKAGIPALLEMIALQAEVLELKANPNKLARGLVIDAKLDRNRGPLASVLVQDGTLKAGDTVVAGEHIGKVRAMLDDKGRTVSQAGPATPVEVLGLSGVPYAGETFNAVADEKAAKELVEHRRDARRKKELAGTSKVSLENILDKIREGAVKELKIVLKADVQGSSEALKDALINLATSQVKVDVISSGVGGITESDVNLAKAGHAIIVGFHVRPAGKAAQLAEQEQVDIKLYDIIYEALDDVKKAMAGLLAPVRREKPIGKAEVRQVFTIPKLGTISGCAVTEGVIRRSSQVRLVRDAVQLTVGKVSSLRRFKDDVREVASGYECGIGIEGWNDVKEGDIIEAFEIEEYAPTLQ